MKTFMPKKETITEKWYIVDAKGQTVGRLASKIAAVVRGKTETTFAPHVDPRNFVVVINSEQIKFTGNKWREKKYFYHTGWPHGLKESTAQALHEKNPVKVLENAVYGMIPHTRLGNVLKKHIKFYTGSEHPHEAQNPQPLTLTK